MKRILIGMATAAMMLGAAAASEALDAAKAAAQPSCEAARVKAGATADAPARQCKCIITGIEQSLMEEDAIAVLKILTADAQTADQMAAASGLPAADAERIFTESMAKLKDWINSCTEF